MHWKRNSWFSDPVAILHYRHEATSRMYLKHPCVASAVCRVIVVLEGEPLAQSQVLRIRISWSFQSTLSILPVPAADWSYWAADGLSLVCFKHDAEAFNVSFDEERLPGRLGISSLHTVYLRLAHLFNQESVKRAEQCRGLLPPDLWLDTVLRSPGLVRIHH